MISIGQIHSLNDRSVHVDLINALSNKGHNIDLVCTREKRLRKKTEYVNEKGVNILRLRIGNITNCGLIEKTLSTLKIDGQFINGIGEYFGDKHYDILLYGTPPITFANVIKYCKNRFGCRSFLMLKDIFPQNAVDIGLLNIKGLSGLVYRYFRRIEKKLYEYSDAIGCMSQANIEYLIKHNTEVNPKKVILFPNTITPRPFKGKLTDGNFRRHLHIGNEELIFLFGGNLGKPQGIDFLIDAIKACHFLKQVHFLIVGDGTEAEKIKDKLYDAHFVHFFKSLPSNQYDQLLEECDVGMVILDYRFTIPNYPARILSYMEHAMPVLAATDINTDIKQLVTVDALCGKWSHSANIHSFVENVQWFLNNKEKLNELGLNGRKYLEKNFHTDVSVSILENLFRN